MLSEDVNCIDETLREHVSNIGTILSDLDLHGKKLLRKVESLTKKKTNAEYSVIFNETCIYIYIYSWMH